MSKFEDAMSDLREVEPEFSHPGAQEVFENLRDRRKPKSAREELREYVVHQMFAPGAVILGGYSILLEKVRCLLAEPDPSERIQGLEDALTGVRKLNRHLSKRGGRLESCLSDKAARVDKLLERIRELEGEARMLKTHATQDARIAGLEANQKTQAERELCDWAKCGHRYGDGPYTGLVRRANVVWDEAQPPPKRTLADVEEDIVSVRWLGGCGEFDRLQALFDERAQFKAEGE